ncbi:cytochrome C [Shewanella sp. SNU WT4]|uniref:cytochrome C n=1 Tax=Shewanella sp. SNU WT4 TaxID=2590015 RepID=UPI00112BE0BF|nr:cytochrome C [Shewanella sp. SNU WT4]QDF67219.1 cytochrome C [Shewanella sp. SNU WT4]
MTINACTVAISAACLLLAPVLAQAQTPTEYGIDPVSGLIMAPGWEMVNYQCNACHTSLIIPQNSGSKDTWRKTIQWMVDTQGLWDLSDTWEPVLDYLATHYGETEMDMTKFRRLPLIAEQQPAMPTKESQ